MRALSNRGVSSTIIRLVATVFLSPLAAIGVLLLATLGLAAVLLVIQVAIVILRQLGA